MRLLLATILLSLSLSGCADDDASIPPDQIEVTMGRSSFSPDNLTIRAGDTVVFANHDSILHTATALDGKWDSGFLRQHEEWEHTFPTPGEFPYQCKSHFTTGTIIVE